MYFTVTGGGLPLRMRRYVFSESFAAIGYAAFAKATGEPKHGHEALAAFDQPQRSAQASQAAADDADIGLQRSARRRPRRHVGDGSAVIADRWSGHRCATTV